MQRNQWPNTNVMGGRMLPESLAGWLRNTQKALWHYIRGRFDWFYIDNWTELLIAVTERKSVNMKNLIPNTS